MKRRNLLLSTSAIAATVATSAATSGQSLLAKTEPHQHSSMTNSPKGKMVTIADKLQGYYVTPTDPKAQKPFPAVIVIMEAFGLNGQIKGICDMCAKYGYAALAPDIYYGSVFDYKDLPGAIGKLKTMKDEQFTKELGQSLDFLGKRPEVKATAIGTVGFCMGGRFAFLANAAYPDRIKAAVAFYGGGIASNPDPMGRASLLDRIPEMKSPLLLIYSAEDQYINAEEHARITTALTNARKRYTLSVFPNTQHGFANDQRETYAPAAAQEAWDMTFGLFKRYLKQA